MAYNYGLYPTILKLLKYPWLKTNKIKYKNLINYLWHLFLGFALASGFQREYPFFNHVIIPPLDISPMLSSKEYSDGDSW